MFWIIYRTLLCSLNHSGKNTHNNKFSTDYWGVQCLTKQRWTPLEQIIDLGTVLSVLCWLRCCKFPQGVCSTKNSTKYQALVHSWCFVLPPTWKKIGGSNCIISAKDRDKNSKIFEVSSPSCCFCCFDRNCCRSYCQIMNPIFAMNHGWGKERLEGLPSTQRSLGTLQKTVIANIAVWNIIYKPEKTPGP